MTKNTLPLLRKAQKKLTIMYQDNINNRFGYDHLVFTELEYIMYTKDRHELFDMVNRLFPQIKGA